MSSKSFRLVDVKTGNVRRDSDPEELRIIYETRYTKAGDTPERAAQKAIQMIAAIKAASPEVLDATPLTGVCYS